MKDALKFTVIFEIKTYVNFINLKVGTQIYRAQAHDPDDQPVLRYAIDKTKSTARNEDGIPISITEYDYLSLWDLNAVDGILKIVR